MAAKNITNMNKAIVDSVIKKVTCKPKKVAKTFSVSSENYERLEQWCRKESKKGNDVIKPSNVVDELLGMFLDQTIERK